MLSKTKAIVLHHIKYSESSVIAYCYTRQFGRISFLIPGVRKKKARIKLNVLQALQINDIDFYNKEKPGLLRIKELRSCHVADALLFDHYKSSVALFMAEILYKTLKEEVPNEALFDYVMHIIEKLTQTESHLSEFYMQFLLEYTLYLGFYPNLENMESATCFDLKEGLFKSHGVMHDFYLDGPLLSIFKDLIRSSENDLDIHLTKEYKNALLDKMLDYYMLHTEGIHLFKSLNVLRDIFHS